MTLVDHALIWLADPVLLEDALQKNPEGTCALGSLLSLMTGSSRSEAEQAVRDALQVHEGDSVTA